MKKETGILLAGTLSLITVLGIIGLRKYLDRKRKNYDDYYSDFHRHFERRYRTDDHHGIEFLSMQ